MSDMFNRISVVIPLYNKENEITNTINSVLNQKYDRFEILVVDDGSTDKGRSLIENLKNKKIKIIKQANQGVSAARNAGIENSSFDFIAFIDADDYWDSDFLSTINSLINKYPNAGAYGTGYRHKTHKNKSSSAKLAGLPSKDFEGVLKNYFLSATFGDPPITSSSACIPKRIFQSVGGFPPGIVLGEDLDTWGRIALRYDIVLSALPKATYNFSGSNRVTKTCAWQTEWVFVKTAQNFLEREDVSEEKRFYINEYIARVQLNAIALNFSVGKPAYAYTLIEKIETVLFKKKKMGYSLLLNTPVKMYETIRLTKKILGNPFV